MSKLYRLDIDNVLSNISFFTDDDIGGEGHGIIVEEKNLDNVICELANNFGSLLEDSFEPYEEEEEEEEDEKE